MHMLLVSRFWLYFGVGLPPNRKTMHLLKASVYFQAGTVLKLLVWLVPLLLTQKLSHGPVPIAMLSLGSTVHEVGE